MNDEWRSFLEQNGASISGNEVVDFGDSTTELAATAGETVLCDLSHESVIRVSGEESQTFLQGQLTNDIREVNEGAHQLSGYCSPKGRLLALFRLFQRDGAYYLQLPENLLEPTLKRLRMYVLRSKVELEDVSDKLIRFALCGAQAETLLGKQLSQLPGEADTAMTDNGITVLRLFGPAPCFILYGEAEAARRLWQALQDDGARPAGGDSWRSLQIHAGLPAVLPETVEAFVPQMLNLQLLNGVSFKKGCYTGQEVVARMQYLGKLKRRMYLVHSDADSTPHPGNELFSPGSVSGQGTGRIVEVAPSPQGGYDMLAVLEISSAENGPVYLDEAQQQKLALLELPYVLETPESSPQSAG